MALITHYNVTADVLSVDPETNPELIQGMAVKQDSNGYIVKANSTDDGTILGFAGDSSETSSGHTAYAADLVINGAGAKQSTQNRVNDAFNETLASGKVTVYSDGGKFFTDQFETAAGPTAGGADLTYVPGDLLYVSDNGKLSKDTTNNTTVVGIVTDAVHAYPSGIPGTDGLNGDSSLGDFLGFKPRV